MKKVFMLLPCLILILACGCSGQEKPPVETEKVNVYDTDQYLCYKRMERLCQVSYDEWDYTQIKLDGENRWIYEVNDEISLKIISDGDPNSDVVEYVITRNDSELAKVAPKFHREPTNITVYYVDINCDRWPDVMIVGYPPSGTPAGPCWSYAYDLHNEKEIALFDESGYLTEEQEAQMEALLTPEFYDLFKEWDQVGFHGGGAPIVDAYGNLYYSTGIMNHSTMTLGSMLLLLSYDKETERFRVKEVLYMPDMVEEQ